MKPFFPSPRKLRNGDDVLLWLVVCEIPVWIGRLTIKLFKDRSALRRHMAEGRIGVVGIVTASQIAVTEQVTKNS
jgi:hypothetical protein